jgi:hypothetical protein
LTNNLEAGAWYWQLEAIEIYFLMTL